MKNFEIFINELYGINIPIGLRKLKDTLAIAAVNSGDQNKDKVNVNMNDKISVDQLKPAQKEIIASKALGFALSFLEIKKPDIDNMEAIVSNDNYIMDGHHRWAAAWLLNPKMEVGFVRIDLPANDLISALNVYTKGALKINGNEGVGDIKDFSINLSKILDNIVKNGIPKDVKMWPFKNNVITSGEIEGTTEKIREIIGKVPGANGDWEKGYQILKNNANLLPKGKLPTAPERIDMPVIDANKDINGDNVNDVKKSALYSVCRDIANGKIDIKEPHSNQTETALKESILNFKEYYENK